VPERVVVIAAMTYRCGSLSGTRYYWMPSKLTSASRTITAWMQFEHICWNLAGDRDGAIRYYRSAAGKTESLPERNYLLM
jgi:hypothetical protein